MFRTAYYQKIEKKLRFNNKHFSAFLDHLESNSSLDFQSSKDYLSSIAQFLLFLDKHEISIDAIKFLKPLIRKYSDETRRNIGSVFRSAMKLFLSVVRQNTSLSIVDQDIDEIDIKKRAKRRASPLSIRDVFEIRNRLITENKYRYLFAFEVFFTYGIKLKQYQNLTRDNFSLSEQTFTIEENKPMLLSQVIFKLLIDHDDLPNPRESTVQGNIKKIGELVERDKLIWQDIIASRNEYFPTCTKCMQKYPNTDEFWALLEYKDDQSKTRWFLCRSCAQKQLNGEIK